MPRIVGFVLLERGECVGGRGRGLDTVEPLLQVRLKQVQHEPVALGEVAAAAGEEEHPGVPAVRSKPDVDPVVDGDVAVELVPDLGVRNSRSVTKSDTTRVFVQSFVFSR